MHHPRARGGGGLGDGLGPFGLHRVKRLRAALGQDADQVDRDLRIAHRRLDGGRIAQIGLHGVDLADPAERLQVPGQFRPPHRHPDPVVALGQRPHHVSPRNPDPPKYRDERFQVRCHGQANSCRSNSGVIGVFSGIAIRQRDPAVQRICEALKPFDKRATDPYQPAQRPGGGIGRRAGFRCQWLNGREGSSPFLGTTSLLSERFAIARRHAPHAGQARISPEVF